MAWIDYKKAYNMVSHSWIIECLDLFGVADNIKSLLVNSMEKVGGNAMFRKLERYFSSRFFVLFSVCFSVDSTKYDFKKGEGSI